MQLTDASEVLGRNALFSLLADEERRGLQSAFAAQICPAGTVLARPGDPVEGLWLAYSGRFRVSGSSPTGRSARSVFLERGDSLFEPALLGEFAAGHRVEAETVSILMRLSRRDYAGWIGRFPGLQAPLEECIRQPERFDYLKKLGLLAHLSPGEVQQLLCQIGMRELQDGEFLFRAGDPSDACYQLQGGEIRVFRPGVSLRQIRPVREQELLGELSMLQDSPRMAAAQSAGRSTLLELKAASLRPILSESAARQLAVQLSAGRLRSRSEAASRSKSPGGSDPHAAAGEAPMQVRWVQVRSGRRSLLCPLVPVPDAARAGDACLAMIHAWHGREPFADGAVEDAAAREEPASLIEMARKAEDEGYLTRMLEIGRDRLPEIPLPAIILDRDGNPALLFSASAREVVLASPLSGISRHSLEQFVSQWNGQVLTLLPVQSVIPETRKGDTVWQRLRAWMRPYSSRVWEVGILSLLIQLLGIGGPLLTMVIIDRVLVSSDLELLGELLVGMGLITVFHVAASGLREHLVAHTLRRLNTSLQLGFLHHILALPQKIFSTWQGSDFARRFRESEGLQQLISKSGIQVLIDSLSVFAYFVALLLLNLRMTMLAAAFVAAYALLMKSSTSRMRRINQGVFRARQAAQSRLTEILSGIQTVKSMAMEGPVSRQGERFLNGLLAEEFRYGLLASSNSARSSLINQAAALTLLGYGAFLALHGGLTAGTVVAFLGILGAILNSLNGLVSIWDELQEIRISLERADEVMQLEREEHPSTAISPLLEGHVAIRNLTFRYPNNQEDTLVDINLTVLPGQKVALVGRSGSGKTTLANLLTHLYPPGGGSIFLDQMDIQNIRRSALRRQVGYVEQHPTLFDGSVRDNIALANPGADIDRVVAAATLACAHEFISRMPEGYDTVIGERGTLLSGGERQRLILARTILANPRVLIFDEATSSLDSETEGLIYKNLETVFAGRTLFVISHRLSAIRDADLIVTMDQGRVVETGNHSELMAQHGLYYYLNTRSA